MKFKMFVKVGTFITQVILAITTLIVLMVFAMQPTQPAVLTNALILILILVQLYAINVLISIYEKIEGGKKK